MNTKQKSITNKESGQRLSQWIANRGWTKAEFARRMEILPQTVTKYINGDVGVDNLVVKLLREGADIHWILTGEKHSESNQQEMMQMLKGMGITSPEQLSKFLEAAEKIKRMATLLHNEVTVIGSIQDVGRMVRVPVIPVSMGPNPPTSTNPPVPSQATTISSSSQMENV
jgi:transcriptional regulator with XRE-family HTH domain